MNLRCKHDKQKGFRDLMCRNRINMTSLRPTRVIVSASIHSNCKHIYLHLKVASLFNMTSLALEFIINDDIKISWVTLVGSTG